MLLARGPSRSQLLILRGASVEVTMPYATAQLAGILPTNVESFFINSFFPFLALLSGIFFLWGVVTAITAFEDDQYEEGKRLMTYGLVGIIIFSILWGIFYFSLAPSYVPTDPALLNNRQ